MRKKHVLISSIFFSLCLSASAVSPQFTFASTLDNEYSDNSEDMDETNELDNEETVTDENESGTGNNPDDPYNEFGDPNSTNTNVKEVEILDDSGKSVACIYLQYGTYSGITGEKGGNLFSVYYISQDGREGDLVHYPNEENISVTVEDGDNSYYTYFHKSTIGGKGWSIGKDYRVWHQDPEYATVENFRTDDGGKTWTFTVRAADRVTTEDYTIEIQEKAYTYFDCGHNSYQWLPDEDGSSYSMETHSYRCSICSKYEPYKEMRWGDHEWDVTEWIPATWEKEGRKEVDECKVCGIRIARGRDEADIIIEDGADEEELLRIPPRNERRIANGLTPISDKGSALEDLRNSYENDSDDEETDDTSTYTTQIDNGINGSWQQNSTGWWFVKNEGGYPISSWYECATASGRGWYHFNASGYMDHGWLTDADSNTYYLHDVADGNYGAMYTGWNWINGKCYYFNVTSGYNGLPGGALLKNATAPDGYTVNESGEWTVNGVVQTR